ncbi:hypothetical protein [Fluviicola sp.]|uniref:hypothetical protein n=1 Tax=Fluviicola sp. TaxID=1917219 RepID=UPI00263319F9|nr:hypothetical protein [Fluviicola sp.]
MKNTISLIIILLSFSINAQTEAELIGKWKLVKWTQNGKEKNLQDHFHTDQVFQVFLEKKHQFQSLTGEDVHKGKWKLSSDGKSLTIIAGILPIVFSIDYFDAKKRVITQETLGTLEYEKVPG